MWNVCIQLRHMSKNWWKIKKECFRNTFWINFSSKKNWCYPSHRHTNFCCDRCRDAATTLQHNGGSFTAAVHQYEWSTGPPAPSPTAAAAARPLHQKTALQVTGREGGWERTRLSVSTPPWPPGGRQPENLNEIFKSPASYLQCVGQEAQQRQA